jgi:hypothetical protein
MPLAKKTACISTGGYYPARALFAPQAPQEEEVVVISDDEEDPALMEDITEEDEEKWVASPTPAPAPAPAPALVPAPAPEPLLEEAVQVLAPAAPEVEDEPGWTSTYHFKYAPDMAYYHSLWTTIIDWPRYCTFL